MGSAFAPVVLTLLEVFKFFLKAIKNESADRNKQAAPTTGVYQRICTLYALFSAFSQQIVTVVFFISLWRELKSSPAMVNVSPNISNIIFIIRHMFWYSMSLCDPYWPGFSN